MSQKRFWAIALSLCLLFGTVQIPVMANGITFEASASVTEVVTPNLSYSAQILGTDTEGYTVYEDELPTEVTLLSKEYYANELTDYQKALYRGFMDGFSAIEAEDLTLKQMVQLTYSTTDKAAFSTQAQFDSYVNNALAAEAEKIQGQLLYNAVQYDYTELFWMRGATGATFNTAVNAKSDGTNVILYFTVSMRTDASELFGSDAELRTAAQNMESAVDAILAAAPTTNEYDKVEYFNNWLKQNNTYNHTHLANNNYPLAHTAYSAFLSNNNEPTGPVCQGYAYAFKYLCNLSDIDCVVITGDLYQTYAEPGPHAWDAVELDGAWYGVDVTSNDSLGTDEYNFLVGSTTPSHDPTYTTFATSHVIDAIHTYPTLSTTAYEAPELFGKIALVGANIRVGTNAGLRFGTRVTKNEFFNKYYSAGDENNTYVYSEDNNIMFGTLLIPDNLLKGSTLQEMFKTENSQVLDIPAKNIYSQDKNSIVFTGVVTNIPKDAKIYDQKIVAVSYIKYREDEESEWNYVFSEKDEASYLSVAKAARASDYSDANNPTPTEEVQNVIKQLDEIIELCEKTLGWVPGWY